MSLSASLLMSSGLMANNNNFISSWSTYADNQKISLPLLEGGNYNFKVDWGDGLSDIVTRWNQAEKSHVYAKAGTYTVTINGVLEGFAFYNRGDKSRIVNIRQWGGMKLSYPGYHSGGFFYGCYNLNITAKDSPDLTYTTSMNKAFAETNVIDIRHINNWDLSSVTSMSKMFYESEFDEAIGRWDVSAVVDMSGMFGHNGSFNQDLSRWNVAAVTDMRLMFNAARDFNQNINAWDTSSVTSMEFMFDSALDFNRPLDNWNLSKVTNIDGMFYLAREFNQNISGWNTSAVTSMRRTFHKADAFDQDLSVWNIDNVMDMTLMFNDRRMNERQHASQPIPSKKQNHQQNMALRITHSSGSFDPTLLDSGHSFVEDKLLALQADNSRIYSQDSIAIVGNSLEGSTLTSNIHAITDQDRGSSISYQWRRNNKPIASATESHYLLTNTDVGHRISLSVSFLNGYGNRENLVSPATKAITNINDSPLGLPTISGHTIEKQTLSVDVTDIVDGDGLGYFHYQWRRNSEVIAGATRNDYTLTNDDVNQYISVSVHYVDGNSTSETLLSAMTPLIQNTNDQPLGRPVINGVASQHNRLIADIQAISDADGLGPLSYQWLRNEKVITGANADAYQLTIEDVGASLSLIVSYTDGHGTEEYVYSLPTSTVTRTNNDASGVVRIIGPLVEDEALFADINDMRDLDGVGAFIFQWYRSGVAILGANDETYTLTDADIGKMIQLAVSYLDGHGTEESMRSSSVGPIANVNDAPTGIVILSGEPREDQVLSIVTDFIHDSDGLGVLNFQWLRDGLEIADAVNTGYQLADVDVNAAISARVSYTDLNGTEEIIFSNQTAVVSNVNDLPEGIPWILGSPIEGRTLVAQTIGIADEDGLGLVDYQWFKDDIKIAVGGDRDHYPLTKRDIGHRFTVTTTYTDGFGTTEVLTSRATGIVKGIMTGNNDLPADWVTKEKRLSSETSLLLNNSSDAPVAYDDIATLMENGQIKLSILANDIDTDKDIDPETIALLDLPQYGELLLETMTGQIIYTPDDGYFGDDQLIYQVADKKGTFSNHATVSLTIMPVNTSPQAVDDHYQLDEDEAILIHPLANDRDIDNGLSLQNLTIIAEPMHGNMTFIGDGQLQYQPDTDYFGEDQLFYVVSDEQGAISNVAKVQLIINPINDAPIIKQQPEVYYRISADEMLAVVARVVDPESDTLIYNIKNQPEWLFFNVQTGAMSGRPTLTDSGYYENVQIVASDGKVAVALDAFDIDVRPSIDTRSASSNEIFDDSGRLIFSRTASDEIIRHIPNITQSSELPPDVDLPRIVMNASGYISAVPGQNILAQFGEPYVEVSPWNHHAGYRAGHHVLHWLGKTSQGQYNLASQDLYVYPRLSFGGQVLRLPEGVKASIEVRLSGPSPEYPLVVSLAASGSATAGVDHSLQDSQFEVAEGDSFQIPFTTHVDTESEADEYVDVTVRIATHSGHLLGTLSDTRVIISEGNIAPSIQLHAVQNHSESFMVINNSHPVEVFAAIDDPNSRDTSTVSWEVPAGLELLTQDDMAISLDPHHANVGAYPISATITDQEGLSTTAILNLRVVDRPALLRTSADLDQDGMSDFNEGVSDADRDYMPNYLDAYHHPQALPLAWKWPNSYHIEVDGQRRLSLGVEAIAVGAIGAILQQAGLEHLIAQYSHTGLRNNATVTHDNLTIPDLYASEPLYYSFDINELDAPGDVVQVAIPVATAVANDARLLVFSGGYWHSYSENSDNAIHSVAGSPGICPAPSADRYQAGLHNGFHCVMLVINDGGENDRDGQRNGKIAVLMTLDSRATVNVEKSLRVMGPAIRRL